ncbi:MAG: UvrABC system protein, partial [Actinomycetota bacterium]
FEEVFVPDRAEPVRIPRGSDALYMLQVVRDEAHRFANTFHRERRAKRMRSSELDGIKGLGPKRREALLTACGGIAGVRSASLERLTELLPDDVARAVHERFTSSQ